MKYLAAICLFGLVLAMPAQAEIWKWVDVNGGVHFVDSKSPIYTWTDDRGTVFYSDKPEHESAVSVELVWVSKGELDDLSGVEDDATPFTGGRVFAEESAEDIEARKQAQMEFCERATEVYASYLKAPRLYKSDDNGKRQYLSDKEAKRILSETKAKKDEACNPGSS